MEITEQFKSLAPILELSKANIKDQAQLLAGQINESGSPEIAFASLTKFEELIKGIKDSIKSSAMFEIEQGRDYAVGIKLSIMNATRYEYHDLELERLKEKVKDREQFLKSLKSSISVLDETTGEVVVVQPAIKKVTETIKSQWK